MPAQRYASAVRNATLNGDAIGRSSHRGVKAWLNVTAVPGTDTVTLSVEENIGTPASPNWRQLGACAARVGAGVDVLTVHPEIAAVANVAINAYPLEQVRLKVTHSAGSNFTYDCGLETLP